MKIIIAGGGEVGFHLAKLLSYEEQDITLIDIDKQNLQFADNHLDIKTIRGNATAISVLKNAGVQNADLTIGVTSSQTDNLTISFIAKQLGSKRCISRISNTEYIFNKNEIKFTDLGVDELISPELLATTEIEQLASQSAFNDVFNFDSGELRLVGILLDSNVPFSGKSVSEIAKSLPELPFIPIAIQRKGQQKTIIPRGDTTLESYDQIYFVTTNNGVEKLHELAGKKPEKLKKIMIVGGSTVGIKSAYRLSQKGFDVKLFEVNKEKAYELADELSNVLIINGDGRNGTLLEQENIANTDVFIAATGDSETNVMACMMAKSRGAKKTIALSDNMDYYGLTQIMGIDTLINKKILVANSIFKYIRKGEVLSMISLNNTNAEILEFAVNEKSTASFKKIRDINFPRSAIIAGVIRNGKGYIPLGNFEILPADHIIICTLPEAIRKVENLFL